MSTTTMILRSVNHGGSVFAVGVTDSAEELVDENRDAIEHFLSYSTIVYSSLEKALSIAGTEEDFFHDEMGFPTDLGIQRYTLQNVKFHPFFLTVSKK